MVEAEAVVEAEAAVVEAVVGSEAEAVVTEAPVLPTRLAPGLVPLS